MTREEAIKELQSYADHSWGGLSEAFELAIDALREQEGKDTNVPTKWISVEEKLPKEDGFYLAYGPSIYTATKWYDKRSLAQYLWKHDVTHWMPLPEPPEVEK